MDKINGKKRFLKVLDENFSIDGINVFLFLNSARMSSLLNSKEICKVYDYGKENDHYIIVSEYINSKPLNLFIHEEFPIPLKQIVDVISKIAMALRYAHQHGVVHGLLNPCSIFITDDGSIKIDDFCFHWITTHLSTIEDAEAIFLSYHISPELFKRIEKIDGRADIYSLGVILLQLLTDYTPINGNENGSIQNMRLPASIPSLCNLLADYPSRLEKIVSKSLDRNPENRYWNLKEFIDDLKLLKSKYLVSSKSYGKRNTVVNFKK
ncbi:MAG: serine/threonine-protein kinase [bacterium]